MKLAYFPDYTALNSGPVLAAFLNSAGRYFSLIKNSLDADVAVIWSVLWNGRMQPNQHIWNHYKKHNKPVIILDVGTLRRNITWKIAVDSITALGFYGHQQNLDWTRPGKLGIDLLNNTSRNPKIVIAAQHAKSLQTASLDSIEQWINQNISQLKSVTDRPIAVRPHPRSPLNFSKLRLTNKVYIELPKKIINTYDSYDLAFDCYAMVNYNAGPGIQAALAGTKTIVDQTSLAWPVSTALQDIERPCQIDRSQWLVEICHTEYTVDEISQGAWYQRLESRLYT
jgi:hypothetical protein